jgi:hypothetical protein
MDSGSFVMQIFPELVWTTWQSVGMIFGFLMILYFVQSDKLRILIGTFAGDEIPIRTAVVLAIFFGSPLLLGELSAVVAMSILHPEWFQYLIGRGLSFYWSALVSIALIVVVVHLTNRRKRNAGEVPKNPSPYYEC